MKVFKKNYNIAIEIESTYKCRCVGCRNLAPDKNSAPAGNAPVSLKQQDKAPTKLLENEAKE